MPWAQAKCSDFPGETGTSPRGRTVCFRLQTVPEAFPGARWEREGISGRNIRSKDRGRITATYTVGALPMCQALGEAWPSVLTTLGGRHCLGAREAG